MGIYATIPTYHTYMYYANMYLPSWLLISRDYDDEKVDWIFTNVK